MTRYILPLSDPSATLESAGGKGLSLTRLIQAGLPVLGLCYGMQLLTHTLGGKVDPSPQREYGPAAVWRGTSGDVYLR